jgi:chaperonin GroES
MNLKPLADRVVIKRVAAEETTKTGIILSSGSQEKPQVYEVIEVGPGGFIDGNDVEMVVDRGDKVLVGKYSGTEVKIDGQELTIVRQSDILAIVEE